MGESQMLPVALLRGCHETCYLVSVCLCAACSVGATALLQLAECSVVGYCGRSERTKRGIGGSFALETSVGHSNAGCGAYQWLCL